LAEPTLASTLSALVAGQWPEGTRFFERVRADAGRPLGLGFRAAFASVPRRLGVLGPTLVIPPVELAPLTRPHWTLTDYARGALIALGLDALPVAEQPGFLLHLLEAGEMGEQISILRTLPLWPSGARFWETGVQACRTNARDVFEAIVCDSPYVAAHFPPLNFNQAVMKAIFMGVPVRRIEGLAQRITPELSRMAKDYASERRAAGRVIPEDAEYLMHYGA
jgi:hypothetical protein